MEAAPKIEPQAGPAPFDFSAMANLKPSNDDTTGVLDAPPPEDVVAEVTAESPAQVAPKKPEEDEDDDLIVGDQLDVSPSEPTVASMTQTAPAPSVAKPSSDAAEAETPSSDEAKQASPENNSPDDLKKIMMDRTAPAAERIAMEEERAKQAAMAAGARGGQPAGFGASLVNGIGGGLKLIGRGMKSAASTDPSIPRPMSVAEKQAHRSPEALKAFMATCSEEVLRENVYRKIHNEVTDHVVNAEVAHNDYQQKIGEFKDVLNETPLKDMADKAGTSVGDLIHSIKSGTIKDAAAQSALAALEQSPKFKAAEKGVIDAATKFKTEAELATKSLDKSDVNAPGRMDTNLRRSNLADMAEGMKNDDVAKSSDKIKDMMDEISKMADAIKKAIMDVVNKLGSAFSKKAP